METPRKRITFSTVESTVQLIVTNPSLLSVPSLSALRPIVDIMRRGSTACGCNVQETYNKYRGHFERAITGLTSADVEAIKRLLNVEQVCYYSKNTNNALTRICL